jgi:ribonuclease P protein component
VLFALRNTLGRPRWGLSVPKKVGSAVIRNQIKRRIREIIRREKKTMGSNERDFCILVRPGAARVTLADLRQELVMLSEKVSFSRPSAPTNE